MITKIFLLLLVFCRQLYADCWEKNTILGQSIKAGCEYILDGEKIKFNSLGLRAIEPLPKAKDTTRILLLGSGLTHFKLKNNNLPSAIVQDILEKKDLKVEVIDASTEGYFLAKNGYLLKKYIEHFQPDKVFYYLSAELLSFDLMDVYGTQEDDFGNVTHIGFGNKRSEASYFWAMMDNIFETKECPPLSEINVFKKYYNKKSQLDAASRVLHQLDIMNYFSQMSAEKSASFYVIYMPGPIKFQLNDKKCHRPRILDLAVSPKLNIINRDFIRTIQSGTFRTLLMSPRSFFSYKGNQIIDGDSSILSPEGAESWAFAAAGLIYNTLKFDNMRLARYKLPQEKLMPKNKGKRGKNRKQ